MKIRKKKRLIAIVTTICLIYVTTFVNIQAMDTNSSNDIKINFLNSDIGETILDSVKNEVSSNTNNFNVVNSTLKEADSVIVNIKDMNKNIEMIKKMVEDNKIIYFYGDLSVSEIAKAFNMLNTLKSVKNNALESKKDINDINDIKTIEKATSMDKNSTLKFIGIEKYPWGYSMIKGFSDKELSIYDLAKNIIDDSIHSKKEKLRQDYANKVIKYRNGNTVTGSSTSFGTPIYSTRISNSVTPETQYGVVSKSYWNSISDIYLYRFDDEDPEYDYMTIEIITEFDWDAADKYNTGGLTIGATELIQKLHPNNKDDNVKEGSPSDQTDSQISITVGWPAAVSFSYSSNGKMNIKSKLSLSGNYFETKYGKTPFWIKHLPEEGIYRQVVAFRNYAPSSGYTYVDWGFEQSAKGDEYSSIYYTFFDNEQIYFDY